jgi:ATP-dependent RNA helicase DDX6/DHH1
MAAQYRNQGYYPAYDQYYGYDQSQYYSGYSQRRTATGGGPYRRGYNYGGSQRRNQYNYGYDYYQQPQQVYGDGGYYGGGQQQQGRPRYQQQGAQQRRGGRGGRGYNYQQRNRNKPDDQLVQQQQEKYEVRQVDDDKFDYDDPDWINKIKKPERDQRVKTDDVTKTKGSSFDQFPLKKRLLRGIYEYGFEAPSPVQEVSIPHIMMGNNIVCRAKNGTGKTGAYCIPLLNLIDETKGYVQALVLLPTRELALQTSRFLKLISKYMTGLNILCATGGTSIRSDVIRIKQRQIHIIVATPGRLIDLAQGGYALMGKCRLVVMDEADKLLSEDFITLVDKILSYLPKNQNERQLLLYSATFPASIESFVAANMPQPDTSNDDEEEEDTVKTVYLNLMDTLTLTGVTQYYAYVKEAQKVHCLFTLIKKLDINQCIIFCRSLNRVELLARKITKLGFSCFYIHSKMSQLDRNRVFHEFREGPQKCRYLICTDLITRGIDVKSVNVVINFDFPKAAETYLHRIGRAGRFGHLAIAINFVTDDDRKSLYQIEDDLDTEIKPIPANPENIDKALYCK